MLRSAWDYAFVLAGYTVAIIGLPAISQPLTVFDQAVARCTEISLGILCATLVSALLWPQRVERQLAQQARAAWRAGFKAACLALRGDLLMNIDPECYEAALEQARAVAETRQQELRLREHEASRRARLGPQAISAEGRDNAQITAQIARGQYHEAQAAVRLAELNLARSELRAPRAGQITTLRLAQRIPVRIKLLELPRDLPLSAGMTASVRVAD